MQVSTLQWIVLLGVVAALFVFDLFIAERKTAEFSTKSALRWIVFYVMVAALFGAWIYIGWGTEFGTQFVAGYVTEYSLSVDNLFVFLVILQSFKVPRTQWHRVLLIGITVSLALRAAVILVGVALIERFIGTFIVFGLFLVWTAWKVAFAHEDDEIGESVVVRWLRGVIRLTEDFHDHRFIVKIDGRRHFTPLTLVMVALSLANVLFALDSIPAILGLTTASYLVIAANAFALMGLRQLFFLVLGLIDRLAYLAHGLAVVLAFIGVKLIMEAMQALWIPTLPLISTGTSLLVIVGVLTATGLASYAFAEKDRL